MGMKTLGYLGLLIIGGIMVFFGFRGGLSLMLAFPGFVLLFIAFGGLVKSVM
ncbi:MAG: hypothetical protein R6U32_03855 [Candidatus Woesearchaeota archaeon]